MLRPLVLKGRLNIRIELHRPEVDILVEGKADLKQDSCLEDAWFLRPMTYSAKEHGVELSEFSDRTVRERLTGL